jgi:DNA mismatch repair protein MutS
MGETYEAFYEDAEICSKVLSITLTIRNKVNGSIPFISILSHAVEGCVQKLVAANYKVAIFEQIETRNYMMDITRRDIVRIITPSLI